LQPASAHKEVFQVPLSEFRLRQWHRAFARRLDLVLGACCPDAGEISMEVLRDAVTSLAGSDQERLGDACRMGRQDEADQDQTGRVAAEISERLAAHQREV
jgi:hypothetical protein